MYNVLGTSFRFGVKGLTELGGAASIIQYIHHPSCFQFIKKGWGEIVTNRTHQEPPPFLLLNISYVLLVKEGLTA